MECVTCVICSYGLPWERRDVCALNELWPITLIHANVCEKFSLKVCYIPTRSIRPYSLALHLQHLLHADDACHAEVLAVLAHLYRLQPFRNRSERRTIRATGAWKPDRNSERNARESQQTTSESLFFSSLDIFGLITGDRLWKKKTCLFGHKSDKKKILFAWMHWCSMTIKNFFKKANLVSS